MPGSKDSTEAVHFSCFLCEAAGLSSAEMEQHMHIFHKESRSRSEGKSSCPCKMCDFYTSVPEELEAHVTNVHSLDCDAHVSLHCKFSCTPNNEVTKERCVGNGMSNTMDCVDETSRSFKRYENTMPADVVDASSQEFLAARCTAANSSEQSAAEHEETCNSMNDAFFQMPEPLETSLRLSDCPLSNNDPDSAEGDSELDESCIDVEKYCENMETAESVNETKGVVNSDSSCPVISDTALKKVHGDHTVIDHDSSCDIEAHKVPNIAGGARPKIFNRKEQDVCFSGDKTFIDVEQEASGRENIKSDIIDVENGCSDYYSCPFCSFSTSSDSLIQLHVDQEHLKQGEGENASEFSDDGCQVLYSCPFCGKGFDTPNDLSGHINRSHPDGDTGGGSSVDHWSDSSPALGEDVSGQQLECPVCGLVLTNGNERHLSAHINGHFASPSTSKEETDKDYQMAMKLQVQESSQQREENKKFKKIQEEFGMDTSLTAKQQYEKNLEKAVFKGDITTKEFHQKKIEYAQSNRSGVDDGSTQVSGLLERLRDYYGSHGCPRTVAVVHISSSTHHFSSSYGDKGWGCGYRNFQMMLSCLMNDPSYLKVLFNGQAKMPSVHKLQQLIESAWKKGFDPQGSQQLGGTVVDSRKWIGATEIVATLSSLKIKCRLLDFVKPSGPDSTHPAMMQWVRDYFKTAGRFKPPLYLQHQGHSRTIVGIEELRNGNTNLLLFDPGTTKARMQQFHDKINYNLLQTVRKTMNAFRAKQYQIVAVTGILDDKEYERSKTVRSTKMS